MTSLHLLLGVFGLLTGIGLVMVLSASSARAAAGPTGSAFSLFQRHVLFVSLGAVLFYLGLRTPLRLIRRLGLPAVLVSVVLLGLVLVPGIGSSVNGSRSWFVVGSLSLQPSEAAKVAVAVWGAHLLATRRPHLAPLRHLLVPLLPVVALLALLILLQPDLGTTITLAVIVAALLWFGGMSIRLFVLLASLAGAGALAFALTVGPRSARISSWLNPNANLQSTGYQALQARYSLADGGWAWGRAGRSGTTYPMRTMTSFSPSSERSWGSSGARWCWGCLRYWPAWDCASPPGRWIRFRSCSPPRARCGWSDRPSSTSDT